MNRVTDYFRSGLTNLLIALLASVAFIYLEKQIVRFFLEEDFLRQILAFKSRHYLRYFLGFTAFVLAAVCLLFKKNRTNVTFLGFSWRALVLNMALAVFFVAYSNFLTHRYSFFSVYSRFLSLLWYISGFCVAFSSLFIFMKPQSVAGLLFLRKWAGLKLLPLAILTGLAFVGSAIFWTVSKPADKDIVARATVLLSLYDPATETVRSAKITRAEKAIAEIMTLSDTITLEPDLRLKLATAYYNFGDQEGAERQVRQILSEDPQHAGALLSMGKILLERKEIKAAEKFFRALWKIQRKNEEVLLSLGDTAALSKKWTRARQFYRQAHAINPGNPWVLIRLGNLHMMKREPERALEYFEKALVLDPKNKNARLAYFTALKNRGQEARRFDLLSELYAEDPAFGNIYAELGEFYRLHGFYRKAELHYRAHLRQYPSAAGAHYLLGALLVDLKRPREAIKSLERANELGLTNGDLYYRLSQAHFQLKHLDRAYQMAKVAKKNGYPVSIRWIQSLEAALRVYPRTSK